MSFLFSIVLGVAAPPTKPPTTTAQPTTKPDTTQPITSIPANTTRVVTTAPDCTCKAIPVTVRINYDDPGQLYMNSKGKYIQTFTGSRCFTDCPQITRNCCRTVEMDQTAWNINHRVQYSKEVPACISTCE